MASYQTVPAADEPLLQKPKSSSGKYIMAVAFVATFAIGMLAGSLAVTKSEVEPTSETALHGHHYGHHYGHGNHYSYSYVLCPGLDKEDYCDCDGDCTEQPEWCSCSDAVDCCSVH